MTNWYTADLHFGHEKVIKLSKRPFADINEMHEALIKNWNSRVQAGDTVYVLGDFAYKNKADDLLPIFNRLRAKSKKLIIGNHDAISVLSLPWDEIHSGVMVKDDVGIGKYKDIWLSHYPHRDWPKQFNSSLHMHGHTHNNIVAYDNTADVGVDAWNYTPVTAKEVYARMLTMERNPDFKRDTDRPKDDPVKSVDE